MAHRGKGAIVNRVVVIFGALVAASALVASASPAGQPDGLSAQDLNYLQTSISGDRFEIIGGKLAMKKGTKAQIRALGERLVTDHRKSLQESLALAKANGVAAPQAPTPSMVWELNTVAAMTGSAFDKSYSSLEVKDHQQDIEETAFEIKHGAKPEIKDSAKKELPILRMHLRLATKANRGA
jgi:putative membrane protein